MSALLLGGQIGLIVACALALCSYVGWGITHLGIPLSLRPYTALLIPLIGYVCAICVGYAGVRTLLNARWSLALVFALATLVNAGAWRRGVRPHLLAWLRDEPVLVGLVGIAFLAGIAPILRYGYLTVIGQGWDAESALALAPYLGDYPVTRIAEAPSSPLRDLVQDPPRIGLNLGFAIFHAMTMQLSGQSALATFAPLMALLRALGILAGYVWLRATMGLGRPAALLGAALTAAGSLLLWVTFFNFENQIAAWPLLTTGLVIGLAAVEELALRHFAAWPVALVAALVLVALLVAYYPVLSIWGPIALALGAIRLVESVRSSGPRPGSLALAALMLAALTFLLALLPIQDYFRGFSFRYSFPGQKIGPDRFISATDILGLTAFRLADGGIQPPAAFVLLAMTLAGAFALAGFAIASGGLAPGDSDPTTRSAPAPDSGAMVPATPAVRLRWLAVVAAVIGSLAWLRYIQPFQYGYMKGAAYAGFVLWGPVALGVQALAARQLRRWHRAVMALALVPLLAASWSQALIIGEHAASPAIFTRDIVAVEEAARQVPAGATVVISSDESFTGPTGGLLSALLYGREQWGHVVTAYSNLNYWPEGRLPRYALLAANERPWPLELGGQELWRSQAAVLYRLDDRVQMLHGRSAFYSAAPPLNGKAPASLALWRRGGPYRAAGPGERLTLLIGDTLRFGPGQPGGAAGGRRITLTVASLVTQTAQLTYGDRSESVTIAAGVSTLDLQVDRPTVLVIAPEAQLALTSVVARPQHVTAPALSIQPDSGRIAWSATARQRGPAVQVQLTLANPGRHALRAGLTVVEDTFARPYQVARLLAALPVEGAWQINLDPMRGTTEALTGKTPTPLLNVSSTPNPPDGAYFGVLTLYDGETIVAHEPVFTMRLASGKIATFDPVAFTVEATPVGKPAQPLPASRLALLDGGARVIGTRQAILEQAVLERQPPWPGAAPAAPLAPGAPLRVQLFWRAADSPAQALMVSVQVLGADDRKWAQWDGPIGGDWRPIQGWQPGDRVRQDVPLALDKATPPGVYRLLLVVYDPRSGRPLSFGGQTALLLGELSVQ